MFYRVPGRPCNPSMQSGNSIIAASICCKHATRHWSLAFVALWQSSRSAVERERPSAPRFGTGGASGRGRGCRHGASRATVSFGEECADDGSCVSVCGEVAACVFGGSAQCCGNGRGVPRRRLRRRLRGGRRLPRPMLRRLAGRASTAHVSRPHARISEQLCGERQRALLRERSKHASADRCVPLSSPCELGEDCEEDELCEQSLGVCIPRDSRSRCASSEPDHRATSSRRSACRWTPPPAGDGASAEEIEIAGMGEVVMTPSVAKPHGRQRRWCHRYARYAGHRVRQFQSKRPTVAAPSRGVVRDRISGACEIGRIAW